MNHREHASKSLNLVALMATLHCLAGCAIGEVLGMVIGTAAGLGNGVTVAFSIALSFASGFALTMRPLLASGLGVRRSLALALAADTASIGLMEVVDNLLMLVVPGAMNAPLTSALFWGSLALSLVLAGVAAFPLNRWLIARGKGHAVVHGAHTDHSGHAGHDD